jgi:hypothetical protein
MGLPGTVRAALRRRQADIDAVGDRVTASIIALRDTLRERLLELAADAGDGDWRRGLLAVQLDDVAAAIAELTGEAQDEWLDGLDDVERATPAHLRALGLDPASVIDTEALAVVIDAARRDARDAFRASSLSTATDLLPLLREGYRLESLSELSERLAVRLQVSTAQAATEARTQTAVYARAVAGAYADEMPGVLGYAYGGPEDGLTRPFCAALVGLWVSRDLAPRLDNQVSGLPHPLDSGGGYNCRHSWLAVPLSTAERWGYRAATEADVREANAAASR